MHIVDSIFFFLDQTAGGGIVFGCRQLEGIIVGYPDNGLHQSFTEGALTDNYPAVKILDCAGYNFRRGCTLGIDKHRKRKGGIEWRNSCYIGF